MRWPETREYLAVAAAAAGAYLLIRHFDLGLGAAALLGAGLPLVALRALRWRRRRDRPARLRFTREGRYFVGLSLAVGFGAINTGNNLLYLVLGMMLSMIIVSGVLSELTLQGLRIVRRLPGQVYADRPFLTGIAVSNEKRRLPSFSVQVEDVIDGRPQLKRCYFLKVPADARQQTSYRGELPRRGRYHYGGFRLSTRFPFGFFIKTRERAGEDDLVVLPRILTLSELPARTRDRLGLSPRPRRGAGREFHGLRDYRDGEDARDIHWKRSAREGRLVLREYESEGGRHVTVFLNNRVPEAPTGQFADEIEHCVDLAATLTLHFAQQGYAVQLVTAGEQAHVDADGRGLHGALRMLALMPFVVVGPDDAPLRSPARAGGLSVAIGHLRSRGLADTRGYAHVFEHGG